MFLVKDKEVEGNLCLSLTLVSVYSSDSSQMISSLNSLQVISIPVSLFGVISTINFFLLVLLSRKYNNYTCVGVFVSVTLIKHCHSDSEEKDYIRISLKVKETGSYTSLGVTSISLEGKDRENEAMCISFFILNTREKREPISRQ